MRAFDLLDLGTDFHALAVPRTPQSIKAPCAHLNGRLPMRPPPRHQEERFAEERVA
jgi:hypothetical protein